MANSNFRLPSLVRETKTTPEGFLNPEDTGLDQVIEKMVEHESPCTHSHLHDMASSERVLDYATRVVTDLETDKPTIEHNQRVLQHFIDNPALVTASLESPVLRFRESTPHTDWSQISGEQQTARSYVNFVNNVSAALAGKEAPMDDFVNAIEAARAGPINELSDIAQESESPFKIRMFATFTPVYGYSLDEVRMSNSKVSYHVSTARSGEVLEKVRKMKGNEDRYHSAGLIGHEELGRLMHRIKKNLGVIPTGNVSAVITYTQVPSDKDDEFRYSERGQAHVKIRGKKFKFWKSAGSALVSLLAWEKPKAHYEEVRGEFDMPVQELLNNWRSDSEREKYLSNFFRDIRKSVLGSRLRWKTSELESGLGVSATELRYLSALAKNTKKIEESGVVPVITPAISPSESNEIFMGDMHDPLLVVNGTERVVANEVRADLNQNVFLITGPNKNGKTTYKDGIANSAALAQAGWKIFASSARISPRDRILTHFVKPGDLVAGESRYEHELSRIGELFDNVTDNSLVMIDELGTATSHADGLTQARGVLKQASRTNAIVYFSTHYHELIDEVTKIPNAANLQVQAHREGDQLVYTYKVASGSSRNSEGVYLARTMGVDESGLAKKLETRAARGELTLRV